MSPLETYLRELHDIRFSGAAVPETSYYPALSALLNDVGKGLKPRVRCIINIKNRGAGIPDGGFFTPDQFGGGVDGKPLPGQPPARGVLEVKGTGEDVRAVATGAQVAKYLRTYRLVLVTNYRDFLLVGDADGAPVHLESYRLAPDEDAFWRAAALPGPTVAAHGDAFVDFLRRAMLHAAPLSAPRDVAWFLASCARAARARVEAGDLPALDTLRAALQEALGLTFEGERGDHFFRSTLVQTLFYGVFSAWVLWSKQAGPASTERFDWQKASWTLRVPVISTLFEQIAMPSKLEPLGLVEVLDWTAAVLNRVDRAAFFARFEEDHAVQYFYEPFLEAFDPALRRELGVWYTPLEVVRYMVARVDAVLREELGLPDGLADRNVYVLDPCCGTGTYLVEVLRHIAATLHAKGDDALAAHDLKVAATTRVFGFELLPAPFVVAHLQLGLLLENMGAPLSDRKRERAGVYLTNALTGWQPPKGPQQHLPFPGLEEERDAAGEVKRDKPILVVLGNPPYSGYAGVAVGEERDLSEAYRVARRAKQPQGQGLNDLYVRFYRMAERRIVEQGGRGVVCYISNYSWLDGLSFTAMRERYLDAFDKIWVDNLNGDKYKTGKLTPEGAPDPSIFSTEWNREGIQVGTAVATLARKATHAPAGVVLYRDLWGKGKRAALLEESASGSAIAYREVTPPLELGLTFLPMRSEAGYLHWPSLPDLFPVSFPGVKTSRDDVVVDIDRDRLVRRMEQYFDPAVSDEDMRRIAPEAMQSTARFQAGSMRAELQRRGFLPENIVRYSYRPFDVRWLYWEPATKLLDEKRADYQSNVSDGNPCLVSQQKPRRDWSLPQVIRAIGCIDLMDRSASCFPLYLRPAAREPDLFSHLAAPPDDRQGQEGEAGAEAANALRPNVRREALGYVCALFGVEAFRGDGDTPSVASHAPAEALFFHAVAVLHAPAYRAENAGALEQDWPRVPLPGDKEALLTSAGLGRQVAALLDTEGAVEGVTAGAVRPELRAIGVVSRAGGGALQPDAGDLAVTAGWGHAGKGGITMPGKGKAVERAYTEEECAAIMEGAATVGLTTEHALGCLGETTYDIYLNGVAHWRNIPTRVWGYTIGGYQVMKKWLSYRERDLLGRSLTPDEAREVRDMARRIAALLLLEPRLDATYERVKATATPWPPTTNFIAVGSPDKEKVCVPVDLTLLTRHPAPA